MTARETRWHQLEDAVVKVIQGLKGYLHTSVTGVPIYVTAPFCFEDDRGVTLFYDMLDRVCKDANCHFVSVPWDKGHHVQVKTKTPLKHFNTVGVKLLTETLLGAFPSAAQEPPSEIMSQSALLSISVKNCFWQ